MIWVLHSDIIFGDIGPDILIYNAYEISYIREKEKWILLKAVGMVTEWHWMVFEWSLKCTCHSVDWMVTKRSLKVLFRFFFYRMTAFCLVLKMKDFQQLPTHMRKTATTTTATTTTTTNFIFFVVLLLWYGTQSQSYTNYFFCVRSTSIL